MFKLEYYKFNTFDNRVLISCSDLNISIDYIPSRYCKISKYNPNYIGITYKLVSIEPNIFNLLKSNIKENVVIAVEILLMKINE